MVCDCAIFTFCVSRRRRKMYCGHARLCLRVCVCVCLSAAACPHYWTDPDETWDSGKGCLPVVHWWANLQSVHGLRCYGNMTCWGRRFQRSTTRSEKKWRRAKFCQGARAPENVYITWQPRRRPNIVWLASDERRRCTKDGKTRNPLKFARVPQTRQQISTGRSSPYCGDMWRTSKAKQWLSRQRPWQRPLVAGYWQYLHSVGRPLKPPP